MKRFTGKGIFLAGLILAFAQVSIAADGGRTKLKGPGKAEVVAGTGYNHTLFDSADNKCQHCHNQLYDKWKSSMHAQSWEDPIFQSKYQDFLRLQLSKIGATGPTGTYGEGTIQKSAKVCIKCHAPTAYYSNDYRLIVARVGDINEDPNAYNKGLKQERNLAPAYNPEKKAVVSSMGKDGIVRKVSYDIGHKHNREGINCAFCHSIETVRMLNDLDSDDEGQYELANPLKMGPIGPLVYRDGDVLDYNTSAHDPEMNAFFALIGPETYYDISDTPDAMGEFDVGKKADGRYTMKSTPTGCNDPDDANGDGNKECHFTGGPYYGPFGVTGLGNSRTDDATDRESLVKASFQAAVDASGGDKFESRHQFAAYGKALCLSCHQRSSLMLNPESNGVPGIQTDPDNGIGEEDQFLELCSTWTAMSDGVDTNYTDTATGPKCQRCHMEPLDEIKGENSMVLHQWDQPGVYFTSDDADLTHHFLPPVAPDFGTEGPVAEGYLNNHAFMGANTRDFGLGKIKSGFESDMQAGKDGDNITVETYLQNLTAHMFPGAHPMRRVATRVIVTDGNGDKVPLTSATGQSAFFGITNQLAVLDGDKIKDADANGVYDEIAVDYNEDRELIIQGYTPNLNGEAVYSQKMDQTEVPWISPDATVTNCTNGDTKGPVKTGDSWSIKGCTTVKKIVDITAGPVDHFTRLYGRETGKRNSGGTHVVRPGFDSNIATDNRLQPNERETYSASYNTGGFEGPYTVKYKVYYLKKGGNGKLPTGPDGFLSPAAPPKLAIFEVFSKEVTIE